MSPNLLPSKANLSKHLQEIKRFFFISFLNKFFEILFKQYRNNTLEETKRKYFNLFLKKVSSAELKQWKDDNKIYLNYLKNIELISVNKVDDILAKKSLSFYSNLDVDTSLFITLPRTISYLLLTHSSINKTLGQHKYLLGIVRNINNLDEKEHGVDDMVDMFILHNQFVVNENELAFKTISQQLCRNIYMILERHFKDRIKLPINNEAAAFKDYIPYDIHGILEKQFNFDDTMPSICRVDNAKAKTPLECHISYILVND